jgi:hypothetical protein
MDPLIPTRWSLAPHHWMRVVVFSANIMPGSNGRLALEWFGVLGRSYSIESAPSPAGPWSQYSPFAFPGNNALWGIEFSLSETEDKAFYRVTIE